MGKKIMLIDDEEDVLEFLKTALEDNGYSPLIAGNANDGLSIIREQMPDLVCLDILMPGESGISLFQKLRVDPELKKIPVILNSGLSFTRDLKNIDYLKLEDGRTIPKPDGFIEKPVNIEKFVDLVRELTS